MTDFSAPDLTQHPPRSVRVRLGGFAHLPRLLDKARAFAAGKQGSYVVTKDGTRIFYKDWGSGRPVVFSHGWPLDADAWDAQMLFLVQKGFRVIAQIGRAHV